MRLDNNHTSTGSRSTCRTRAVRWLRMTNGRGIRVMWSLRKQLRLLVDLVQVTAGRIEVTSDICLSLSAKRKAGRQEVDRPILPVGTGLVRGPLNVLRGG